MKYSTYIVYGIKPNELANMRHIDALHACKKGAEDRLFHLTINSPTQDKWCNKRKNLVAYISKSIQWCNDKLNEY